MLTCSAQLKAPGFNNQQRNPELRIQSQDSSSKARLESRASDSDEAITLPEGVEIDTNWAFLSIDCNMFVGIGFDGDDVYIQGFSVLFPEAVVKGSLNAEGQYVFPSGQYLGYYSFYEMDFYMVATNLDWEIIPSLVFDYDAEAKCFTSAQGQIMFENAYPDEIYYYAAYESPSIRFQTIEDQNANPTNPVYNYYYDYYDEYNWTMPDSNVNGYLLDRDRMYYNIYINGALLTLYYDDFLFLDMNTGEPIEEDFEDMPYSNIYTYYLYWYTTTNLGITPMCEGVETMGVQVFFEGFDGELYKSDLVTVDVTSGIADLETSNEVISTEYFNIAGVRVDKPTNGLYIMRSTSANGKVNTQKVLLK
ncbi:MAG: hypothetical protein LIP09_12800 [Bacteroidales bacterium]|nr:hypothetical protein [Bacteroidales bacterium]